MINRSTFLSVAIILAIVLAGRSPSVSAENTVTLIAHDSWPYIFKNPKTNLRGLAIEIEEAAFARVGIKTEFVFMPFSRAKEMVKRGNFAGLVHCSRRPEREEFFLFSQSPLKVFTGFYHRKNFNGPKPKSLEDVKGLKTGGYLGRGTFKKLRKINPDAIGFRTKKLGLEGLLGDQIDYLIGSENSTGWVAKTMGVLNQLQFSRINLVFFHLCFSKKWSGVEDLVAKFNKGLAVIKADGTFEKIHDKYR